MTSALQKKIRHHLDRTGHSVAGFEREAGLKTNVLRNILNGQSLRPTPKTLQAIAQAMHCSVPTLLGQEDSPLEALEEGSPLIEHPDLLMKGLQLILGVSQSESRPLTVHKACFLLDEVYGYALQKGDVDEAFVRWFLLKETKEPS